MQPRPASDLAICIRPTDDGRQDWELVDDVGRTVMHGAAADQTAALAMAQFAASAVQALKRVHHTF